MMNRKSLMYIFAELFGLYIFADFANVHLRRFANVHLRRFCRVYIFAELRMYIFADFRAHENRPLHIFTEKYIH